MKKLFYLLISILSLNSGCSSNSDYCDIDLDDVTIIKIPQKKNPELIKSFWSESYFIPMETTSKSLLGEVKFIKAKDNEVFMSDGKKVVCYMLKDTMSRGEINYCINSIGKGPGEYLEIVDISYNSKYLFIYDTFKVNIYKIETGEFVRSIKLDFAAMEMTALDDYLLFFTIYGQNHPESSYELIVLNIKTKKQHKYFKQPDKSFGSWPGHQISKFADVAYYCSPFRNIIYKFNNKAEPVPFALLDCYDGEIINLYNLDNIKRQKDLKDNGYYYFFNNLQIVKGYIGVQYLYKDGSGKVWYNTKDQTSFIERDSYLPKTICNNSIVTPIDSWKISRIDFAEYKNNKDVLKKYSRVLNVTEDDNPCLKIDKISDN